MPRLTLRDALLIAILLPFILAGMWKVWGEPWLRAPVGLERAPAAEVR